MMDTIQRIIGMAIGGIWLPLEQRKGRLPKALLSRPLLPLLPTGACLPTAAVALASHLRDQPSRDRSVDVGRGPVDLSSRRHLQPDDEARADHDGDMGRRTLADHGRS